MPPVIYVPIGSEYYWEVVSGEIIREVTGPVTMSSKFGWVLSRTRMVHRVSQQA